MTKRKQMSIAMDEEEEAILEELRGAIPKGVYLRELLWEKWSKQMGLRKRVVHLKNLYLEKSKAPHENFPLEVGFSSKEELEIENMGRDELGDLIGEVAVRGAKNTLTSFLGLKIRWDDKELSIYGHSGGGPEKDFLAWDRRRKGK
jgi:hypothetical protein